MVVALTLELRPPSIGSIIISRQYFQIHPPFPPHKKIVALLPNRNRFPKKIVSFLVVDLFPSSLSIIYSLFRIIFAAMEDALMEVCPPELSDSAPHGVFPAETRSSPPVPDDKFLVSGMSCFFFPILVYGLEYCSALICLDCVVF